MGLAAVRGHKLRGGFAQQTSQIVLVTCPMYAFRLIEERLDIGHEPGLERLDLLVLPGPPTKRQEAAARLGIKAIVNDLCRVADHNGVRRHPLADHTPGADNRPMPDASAREDSGTEPNPHVMSDHRCASIDHVGSISSSGMEQERIEWECRNTRHDMLTTGEDSHLGADAAEGPNLDPNTRRKNFECALIVAVGVATDAHAGRQGRASCSVTYGRHNKRRCAAADLDRC